MRELISLYNYQLCCPQDGVEDRASPTTNYLFSALALQPSMGCGLLVHEVS
jgi:hypothetical protein